jgi:hypothetical protein
MAQQTEFIPYEKALELKELGFDDKCLAVYFNPTQELYFNKYVNEFNEEVRTSAPLYQQAFRWFRDKHGLHHLIEFDFDIYNAVCNCSLVLSCTTYEEAELACLRKLIEIVKNK